MRGRPPAHLLCSLDLVDKHSLRGASRPANLEGYFSERVTDCVLPLPGQPSHSPTSIDASLPPSRGSRRVVFCCCLLRPCQSRTGNQTYPGCRCRWSDG